MLGVVTEVMHHKYQRRGRPCSNGAFSLEPPRRVADPALSFTTTKSLNSIILALSEESTTNSAVILILPPVLDFRIHTLLPPYLVEVMLPSPSASATEPPKPDTNAKPAQIQPDTLKPSGAELKKQKQAEKAARRAQAVQEKQVGGLAPVASKVKPDSTKGAKTQQRKPGSAAAPRDLPVRSQRQVAAPVPEIPKKEDKTVELFRHLYKPRVTSIAGAGKDVHPAVLALGLQMSSYAICGSCARLVATLQALKKVRSFWILSRL